MSPIKSLLRKISTPTSCLWGAFTLLTGAFFLIELLGFFLLGPENPFPLLFGLLWSVLLAGLILLLPRRASAIAFGILYFISLLWALAQAGYYQVFEKMMWLNTVAYAGEGATFLGNVLRGFPLSWYLWGLLAIGFGVCILLFYPRPDRRPLPCLLLCGAALLGLTLAPWGLKLLDGENTRKDGSLEPFSYSSAYHSMYDAKRAYDICGLYQLTFRDVWYNEIYSRFSGTENARQEMKEQADTFFESRPGSEGNEMTGLFQGKNVIFILMESMDDWLITQDNTPTLYRMQQEGINFTQFYTPGYGSARTLNSELCMNTGLFLPSSGDYIFDYLGNSFRQSIASQLTSKGYSAQVFHYNSPSFYSRGELEPALGYESYISYEAYTSQEDDLMSDCYLFDNPQIREQFFREGLTFNTIITRSAHMSYDYDEELSQYALRQYPQYQGMYASEEEDCGRVKARLVEDMFARLLQELQENGTLENTVIVAFTDHYTYGYRDKEELLALSGLTKEYDLLLEKTPCFIWSADGPSMEVTKTLNSSDLVPTVLNLLGIDHGLNYLGQDAFDPAYPGYAIFPDGSWLSDGVICVAPTGEDPQVLANLTGKHLTDAYLEQMTQLAQDYITISNLLLDCDYYR